MFGADAGTPTKDKPRTFPSNTEWWEYGYGLLLLSNNPICGTVEMMGTGLDLEGGTD